MSRIEAADAVVLAAPVNFYNVNAMFRRFMERSAGLCLLAMGLEPRAFAAEQDAQQDRGAGHVRCDAGIPIPIGTGALRALKVTARILGQSLWQPYGFGLFRGPSEAETFGKGPSESQTDRVSIGPPGGLHTLISPAERYCWQLKSQSGNQNYRCEQLPMARMEEFRALAPNSAVLA